MSAKCFIMSETQCVYGIVVVVVVISSSSNMSSSVIQWLHELTWAFWPLLWPLLILSNIEIAHWKICTWRTGLMMLMDDRCQSRHVVTMATMVTPYWLSRGEHWFRYIVFFYFRYISFVHKILIVITWVVMSGTFINGLHNGWCDHRPYTHGIPDSKVHGAHLGPTEPRWAPCWPHELCYLGCFTKTRSRLGLCLSICHSLSCNHSFLR